MMVVFKKRESVPIARYLPICNVLRQSKTSLILTYRVYRLYDSYSYSSVDLPDRVLSSDACLHVNPIHFLAQRACANSFSVTRPSINQSFTIRYTISKPLRRHSRTQTQLATSVKRHSVPRTWKSRDSRMRAVDERSTFLIMDIIK